MQLPVELSQNFQLGRGELDQILRERTPKVFEAKITTGEQLEFLIFMEPVYPKPRLVIVGAGHIGQALCHQAYLLDFDVILLDNRSEMKAVCPDASEVIIDEIGRGFEQISITKDTYLVIVTPGHQHDAEALKCCIKSDAAYIGMIGTRRKIQLMRENFIRNGWATEREFDRICAPIGLEIHSKTVQEIALSIAAQLVQVRHLKKSKKAHPSVWCIVLAAGESKRMKQQKLLMPYEGKSMIETVVEKAKLSKAENVLVVLGSDGERIEQRVLPLRPLIAENRNYHEGMLSSVQCGIHAVPDGVDAVLILLGDQPMVRTEVMDKLIEVYCKGEKGILTPTFLGKRGHPVLIDLKYREEIDRLDPEKGLRELVYNHPEDVLKIEMESGEVLKDIDTPEDYSKEMK